jgi:RNA polymerase sigma-70 factor, ECF subfamily
MTHVRTIDELIAEVREGNLEAYGEVVRRHQREVWQVASFALHDKTGTEDLVQQAFVVAYERLAGFERGRDFGAWVRAIARNLAREEIRRRVRKQRLLGGYADHLASLGDDDHADEREAALRRALADCEEGLGPDARRALALRYREARDFTTVAAALDRTVAAARQLLQRVRADLRACIEGKLA